MNGVIDARESEIDLKILVRSDQRGDCMAYFFIEIEDGAPVSFQVVCNFTGPLVKCHQPLVDYGLVKVNYSERYEMEIENTSPIPAQILIKNSNNKSLNFMNMISVDDAAQKIHNNSSTTSLLYDKPLRTKKGNEITIDQYTLVL